MSIIASPRTGKQQHLNPNPITPGTASLNDRLNTSYIDVPQNDTSISAAVTRTIADCVGNCITPKQMVGILRVLKAITICFLVLTIAADLMYMSLLEIFADSRMRAKAGGTRDAIIRVYGFMMSVVAIGVEVEWSKVMKSFSGLRGFIPRAMLLFFIATITRSHPTQEAKYQFSTNSGNDDGYTDDAIDDDYSYRYATYDANGNQQNAEVPQSAVVFQLVTSSILGLCGVVYFFLGLLCFDRFTSKAFLSTKNPLITTAIPQPRRASDDLPPGDGSPAVDFVPA